MLDDRVTPTSLEAFVVRIYRNLNKVRHLTRSTATLPRPTDSAHFSAPQTGFLKAFSDQPESFTGFSPLQTVLQQLRIRQVILCPR